MTSSSLLSALERHAAAARLGAAAVGLLLLSAPASADILRVDADLTTGANDGTSWADALQGSAGLHAALAAANPGDEIWIAEGVYIPSDTGDISARFVLNTDAVHVRGGFEGTEASPLDRRFDAGVETVLSGDLLGNDDGTPGSMNDNSARVMVVTVVSTEIVLEDLRITAGGNEANGTNLLVASIGRFRVRRCRCDHGLGSGAALPLRGPFSGGSPGPLEATIVDSVFDFNRAHGLVCFGDFGWIDRCRTENNGGAGLLVRTTFNAVISNVLSVGNGGPGVSVDLLTCELSGGVNVQQCTIVNNAEVGLRLSSTICTIPFLDGGGFILWGNNGGQEQLELAPSTSIFQSHSLIQGASGAQGQTPIFRDAPNGDFTLQPGSPGVDSVPVLMTNPSPWEDYRFDVNGQHRAFDLPGIGEGPGHRDVGAIEFTGSIGSHDDCVAVPNSTGQIGRLFARGSADISAASFSLRGDQLPAGQFAMFLASRQLGALVAVGGPGTLCLGGSVGRFNQPGQIQPVNADGTIQLPVDLARIPQPSSFVAAQPGETWRFQLWHRDVPGPSQFSGTVSVQFE